MADCESSTPITLRWITVQITVIGPNWRITQVSNPEVYPSFYLTLAISVHLSVRWAVRGRAISRCIRKQFSGRGRNCEEGGILFWGEGEKEREKKLLAGGEGECTLDRLKIHVS